MQGERIEGYLDRLYCYALSLAQDRDEARELLQDCAVKALSARKAPKDEAAYRAWLFTILRNAFIDDRRRRRRRVADVLDEDNAAVRQWTTTEQVMVNVLTVRRALRRLSRAHREVVVLIDVGGFTYAEVAGLLGIPVGTVMSRVSRARAMLLAIIADQGRAPLQLARNGR